MRYKLKEIFDLQMGKTPSRNNPDYWCTEDNKWISIADLTKAGKYISDTKEFLSDAAVKESGIKIIPANTVIMSFKLSIGKTAITAEDMYSNEAIMAFHDKHAVDILPEYIFYLFKYRNWDESSNKAVMGKTLNKATLSEMEIDVCSIKKQREIVAVLDKMMRVLVNREKELFLLDNLIKARFVELFVGKKYEIVKAGSIIKEMRNGVSPSTSGGHFEKVLTLSAITQGKFDDKAWKEGFFTDCPSAEKRITEDDFYICRGNGNKSLVGMGVYALENRPDLVFPDTVIAAHIDTERMVLPYLWIMWQQPEVRKQLESGARTTNGTYKINQKVISEIKIICPPINEQEVFADFVKQANKSKVKVQKALDETQKLFDSLMQQYFG